MLQHIDVLPAHRAPLCETELPAAVVMLSEFVLRHWEDTMTADGPKTELKTKRNALNNIRRRVHGAKRAAAETLSGIKAKTNANGFVRALQEGQGLHPWTGELAWSSFVSGLPLTPLLDPKPEKLQMVLDKGGDGFVLAALRRLLHNHMLYVILCDPVLAHLTGRVGPSSSNGIIQVFGDFEALAVPRLPSKPCVLWVANMNNPKLGQCWQSLKERRELPEDDIRLWEAGRRVAIQGFSNDGHGLSFYTANQQEFPEDMRFKPGDFLYIVVLAPPYQIMFQYNTLENGWKKHGYGFNRLTKELFGAEKQQNLLRSIGQGRWRGYGEGEGRALSLCLIHVLDVIFLV